MKSASLLFATTPAWHLLQRQGWRTLSDGIVQIPGFAVVRKDRKVIDHRGVCAYIQEGNCRYKQLKDLNCCEGHESLWLYLRLNRLPRRFSCIIAGVIYHPPKADGPLLPDHLLPSLALMEARYPNCGLLVTGDFNPLNIDGLLNHFQLKQIVKVPTRKKATLDFKKLPWGVTCEQATRLCWVDIWRR